MLFRTYLLLVMFLSVAHANKEDYKSAQSAKRFKNEPAENRQLFRMPRQAEVSSSYQDVEEINEIRKEIKDAVASSSYAHGGDLNKTPHRHKPTLFSFLNFLFGNVGSQGGGSEADSILKSHGPGMAGSKSPNVSVEIEEKLSSALEKLNVSNFHIESHDERSDIQANIVDSNMSPYSHSHESKDQYRELLEIVKITEDLSFPFGLDVIAWKSLYLKSDRKLILIGQKKSSLLLVLEKNGTFELMREVMVESEITCLETYTIWNPDRKETDGVLIVGSQNLLTFLKVSTEIETIWQWSVHSIPRSIKYFQMDNVDSLLLVIDANTKLNLSTANIYQFNLKTKHNWLVQLIPLNNPSNRSDVLNTGRDVILCFAQDDMVVIFKRENKGLKSAEKFKEMMKIPSKFLTSLATFQMGGFSYIAIGGLQPEILRYHRGTFIPQTILSKSWGLVEEFLPIPARTYRDDLVLLVQHRIHFDTHSTSIVEALIWDGESFDTSLATPCHIGVTTINGITCLLDPVREEGILGSVVFQHQNAISLLVPRERAPSGLFLMDFILSPVSNPLKAIQNADQLKDEDLQQLVDRQNFEMNNIQALYHAALKDDQDLARINGSWIIPELTAPESDLKDFRTFTEANEIYFGDQIWTEQDMEISIPALLEILQQSLKELDELESIEMDSHKIQVGKPPANGKFDTGNIRILYDDRAKRSFGDDTMDLKFENLEVTNLNVKFINNIAVDNFVFLEDNQLIVDGSLSFNDELTIDQEVVGDSNNVKSDQSKTVEARSLHIAKDLNAAIINGIPWNEFSTQLVMTNMADRNINLNELHVLGNIEVAHNMEITMLNNQEFPDGFLWTDGSDQSPIVTGFKNITADLNVGAVDCSGTVNNINTLDVITLSGNQYIPGLTTIRQLEVTESLEVKGIVSGHHLDDFLANPNMLQSKLIQSDTMFQDLYVDGPIYVMNDCHGIVIDTILSDVIYKSNPEFECTSFKTFESIEAECHLSSNLINGIEIDQYVTQNGPQKLSIDTILGNLVIGNLYIDGLYDGVNVTEIDQNVIKVSGEQYTGTEITFANIPTDAIDLDMEHIEIVKTFNGLKLDDCILIEDNFELNGKVILNGLRANRMTVLGEIKGKSLINGIDIDELETVRLSSAKAQEIATPCHIETAIIENDLVADFLNGYDIKNLQLHLEHIENIDNFLSSGEVILDTMYVNGSITVDSINGHAFESIKNNAIWLDRENVIEGELTMIDDIYIDNDIKVQKLNNVFISEFLNDLVLIGDESDLHFSGTKIFTKEIHVNGDIETLQINDIFTKNILAKCFENYVTGNVFVIGSVLIKQANVNGYINKAYFPTIAEGYEFDAITQSHVLKKITKFVGDISIGELHLNSGFNDIKNVSHYLGNIIRKDHSGFIHGLKIFATGVHFGSDVTIEQYNDVNLEQIIQEFVYIDSQVPIVINKNIAFDNSVILSDVQIIGDILTKSIMGCDIKEWTQNALRTDISSNIPGQLVFSAGTFLAGNVAPLYLNGIPVDNAMTLHTPQEFSDGFVHFSDVYTNSPIDVGLLVNGLNLQKERENTVMVYGNQHITAPTVLQSARILNGLETLHTVNDQDIREPVTMNGDLYLQGPISFNSVTTENVNTKHLISGINFDNWYEKALWKMGKNVQNVSGNWSIGYGRIDNAINGSSLINDQDVKAIADRIKSQQPQISNDLRTFNKDYQGVCKTVSDLVDQSHQDVYLLSHFENTFKIKEKLPIVRTYFFEVLKQHFLVDTFGCFSHLYLWNKNQNLYEKICQIQTGIVREWIHVIDSHSNLFLVGNSLNELDQHCNISGLNAWRYTGQDLVHNSNFEKRKFVSIKRNLKNPGHFYALEDATHKVIELDVSNKVIEKWDLPPSGDLKFRFLPDETNLGLALSDGKHLSVLSSVQNLQIRKERTSNWLNEQNLNDHDDAITGISKRHFFSERTKNRINELSARFKIMNNARLETISRLKSLKTNVKTDNPKADSEMPTKIDLLGSTIDHSIVRNSSNAKSNDKNVSVGDAFGEIEEATKHLADQAADMIVNIDKETGGTIGNLLDNIEETVRPIVGTSNNVGSNVKLDQSEVGLQQIDPTDSDQLEVNANINIDSKHNVNGSRGPIVGDAFGEIEEMAKQIADPLADAAVEFNSETDDSIGRILDVIDEVVRPLYDEIRGEGSDDDEDEDDQDDELGQSQVKLDQSEIARQQIDTADSDQLEVNGNIKMDSKHNVNGSRAPLVGDAFGEIEEMAKQIADPLADAAVEFNSETDDSIGQILDAIDEVVRPLYDEIRGEGSDDDEDEDDQDDELGQSISLNKTIERIGSKMLNGSLDNNEYYVYLNSSKFENSTEVGGWIDTVKNGIHYVYDKGKKFIKIMRYLDRDINEFENDHGDDHENDHENKHENHHENHHPHHHHRHHHHHDRHPDDEIRSNQSLQYQYMNQSERFYPTNKNISRNQTHDQMFFNTTIPYVKSENQVITDFTKDSLPNIPRVPLTNFSEIQSVPSVGMSIKNVNPKTIEHNLSLETTTTAAINIDDNEQTISTEIVRGLVTAENSYLPPQGLEEIVTLKVDKNHKTFIAVSSHKDHVIHGNHDSILIYEDVVEGKLFQSLSCHQPRFLTSLYLRDETVLAFVESKSNIQIYIYRGVQGFTLYSNIKMESEISQMLAVTLPPPLHPNSSKLSQHSLACDVKYLAVTVIDEIWFLEAKTKGNCFANVNLICT